MLRHFHHVDEKRFQEGPFYADMEYLFQIPDGVPAVMAGRNHKLCAGGKYLVPFDFETDVPLCTVTPHTVKTAAL